MDTKMRWNIVIRAWMWGRALGGALRLARLTRRLYGLADRLCSWVAWRVDHEGCEKDTKENTKSTNECVFTRETCPYAQLWGEMEVD